MTKSNIDFFFLIILIIVVSAFIGLNIVSIVDKKIKNLSINMPKITVPPSEVTINIENDNDEYKISCSNNPQKKKFIKKKPIKKNPIEKKIISKKKPIIGEIIREEIEEDNNISSSEEDFGNLKAFNTNEYE